MTASGVRHWHLRKQHFSGPGLYEFYRGQEGDRTVILEVDASGHFVTDGDAEFPFGIYAKLIGPDEKTNVFVQPSKTKNLFFLARSILLWPLAETAAQNP